VFARFSTNVIGVTYCAGMEDGDEIDAMLTQVELS
jgi:hypothetical protein